MSIPTDGTTTLNGLRFHFLDWGTAGARPLLLLHGGAQTAHSWDEVAPDLARDHHVLALDQRGHGDSDWAPEGQYRRDDFVADVLAFLDDRGWAAPTVMALSLGGLNAIAFAAAHADRLRGLVVVDVAPTVNRAGGQAIAAQLAHREFTSFEEAVARAQAFNPLRSSANIRERLRHALRETPEGRWTYKFDTRIGSGGLESDFEKLWTQVREIRCPTLLVRGVQSAILSRETAARFVRELPGSDLVEVPDAGHSVMGDNPTGFIAAVRPFLARQGL
ncbi:MAG TPA: alpha/beta hydrolase [Candidatus Binatia bacterium]|nr:alpha/beta hydrolase [Candidatus Binatia bacterium]